MEIILENNNKSEALSKIAFSHIPVMAERVIEALNIDKNGYYVDCTAGGGGHTQRILSLLGENGKVLAIDRDRDACMHLEKKFSNDKRVTIINRPFFDLKNIFEELNLTKVDGFLFDLGVSSYQLDSPERGFSFSKKGPLDMRMDRSSDLSAEDIVNNWPENRLAELFRVNGEERHAKHIARRVVERRSEKIFTDTLDLAEFISSKMPGKRPGMRIHPATRCFQALRIEVNQELSKLDESLRVAVGLLKKGGRIGVITFHSLEDRIVKNSFRDMTGKCKCPDEIPICVCGVIPLVKLVYRKAVMPLESEISENPRSRSAKFRCAQKV